MHQDRDEGVSLLLGFGDDDTYYVLKFRGQISEENRRKSFGAKDEPLD